MRRFFCFFVCFFAVVGSFFDVFSIIFEIFDVLGPAWKITKNSADTATRPDTPFGRQGAPRRTPSWLYVGTRDHHFFDVFLDVVFGSLLVPSWLHFGSILAPIWVVFRSLGPAYYKIGENVKTSVSLFTVCTLL